MSNACTSLWLQHPELHSWPVMRSRASPRNSRCPGPRSSSAMKLTMTSSSLKLRHRYSWSLANHLFRLRTIMCILSVNPSFSMLCHLCVMASSLVCPVCADTVATEHAWYSLDQHVQWCSSSCQYQTSRRSGPTSHRPQSTDWSTPGTRDVVHCKS